jgi:hypothetical protein
MHHDQSLVINAAEDKSNSRPWLPAACAAALAILLYAHTLAGTWIYDDRFHAHDDPRLADVSKWREYLTDGYYPGGVDHLWRPLVSLSYAVQWKLGGAGRAWPFHLVNVLLHAGASALVAELARRLTCKNCVATIAGLLFAAHPVHVEAVAYIVGRADSACAVGTLGAMVLFLRPLSTRCALAVFACVLVALLSKEQGLLVPLMLLALWRFRRGRFEPTPSDARAARLLLVLVVFTLAVYIAYREHILPWYWEISLLDVGTQPMVVSGPRDRALIPLALLGRAVGLLLLPLKLAPEYGLAVITAHQSLADPYLYAGALSLVVTMIGAAIACRRHARVVLFLLFCAALAYLMVANVKLIGVVFAERLLYLPSAFVLILIAMGLSRLPGRIGCTLAVLLVAAWGVRGWTYAAHWRDRLSFYERSVRENPASVRLRVLLATELIERRRFDDANVVVTQGLRTVPEYWGLWSMAARIAIEQGRLDDADAAIRRAWERRPFIPELLGLQERLDDLRRAPTTRPGSSP